jgi:hypothetical protein
LWAGVLSAWPLNNFYPDGFGLTKLRRNRGESAMNAFESPCKWPSNGDIQGALIAFIPKNG